MNYVLFAVLMFSTMLNALTLDEIISISLSKSPSLKTINARLEANAKSTLIANKFYNPQLMLTKNTLDSSEAMSQTVLTLKQKIPYFSKLDVNREITLRDENILKAKLHKAKAMLIWKIKQEAFIIWKLKESLQIIKEYTHLTKQNIDLYESYISNTTSQHIGIMKAKLSLSELKIKKSSIKAKIYAAYAKLSYLCAFDVNNLQINLQMGSKPNLEHFKNSLINNPNILIEVKKILKEQAKVKVATLNKYPDFNLLVGYAYRENFNNYFNVGFGLNLPIYGVENLKEQRAIAKVLVAKSKMQDTKISINATLKAYYSQMLSSYEIYHIIQDDSLPQVAHMFEISNSSVSTGSDLFKYIDVLFAKLNLEQKSINAVCNYSLANAKISQLSGEIKWKRYYS